MKRVLHQIQGEPSQGVEVNLSPLIDVVFLLLIFFVVTTVFVEETGLEIDRPRASQVAAVDRTSLMIGLSREGRVVYGGHDVTLNSIRGIVARALETAPQRPVVIMADRNARTGDLVSLIDECKRAGATDVSVGAADEGGA